MGHVATVPVAEWMSTAHALINGCCVVRIHLPLILSVSLSLAAMAVSLRESTVYVLSLI